MDAIVHFVDGFLIQLDEGLELVLVLDVEILDGQDILWLDVVAFHRWKSEFKINYKRMAYMNKIIISISIFITSPHVRSQIQQQLRPLHCQVQLQVLKPT